MPIFSTMSTISDSVLGMGGSEPGGSVRQPMEEREVVPFGDSSLRKKVPREVSDNGSSSFERLMNFKNMGEGSSELCAGIESPTTPTEDQPSLVTIIMPSPPGESSDH